MATATRPMDGAVAHDGDHRRRQDVMYSVDVSSDVSCTSRRRRTTISVDGKRSAVLSGRNKLTIVDHPSATTATTSMTSGLQQRSNTQHTHEAADSAKNRTGNDVVLTVTHDIVDFAFSTCGGYLAIADSNGVLHLFKSQSGPALFSYPIVVAADATDRDTIEAVVFASSSSAHSTEDLIVLTRSGVLIRLGQLHLEEIERTLSAGDVSHSAALKTMMASIQLQQVNVGALREDAKSILVARRVVRSVFVVVANHGCALSVWRMPSNSDGGSDAGIKLTASYDTLPDSSCPVDVQFLGCGRYIGVLSSGGSLSWWDWRNLMLIGQRDTSPTQAFSSVSSRSLTVAVANRELLPQAPTLDILELQPTRCAWTVVTSSFELCESGIDNVSLSLVGSKSDQVQVVVTYVEASKVLSLVVKPFSSAAETENPGNGPNLHIIEGNVNDGIRYAQQLLQELSGSQLSEDHTRNRYSQLIKESINAIGHDLEGSRIIIESLEGFASQLRQHLQSSQSDTATSSEVSRTVQEWFRSIAEVAYKWTTFTLLTSAATNIKSRSLARRWSAFNHTNLLDIMCDYLRRGRIRAVSLLWQRHVRQEAIARIGDILSHVPTHLPLASYEKWLQRDVIPTLTQYVEHAVKSDLTVASASLEAFAAWMVRRIELFAENEDVSTALKLSNMVRPTNGSSNLQWVILRLSGSLASSDISPATSSLNRIEHLASQLAHMQYLQNQHSFNVSLSVFSEETPSTIAMSMLDRCSTAESVSAEIRNHVQVYLQYCGQLSDPVLLEYISETLESSSTNTVTEQERRIAIIQAIADVEMRAKAALLFFDSVVPPFSTQVKAFTEQCVKWDTQRIDEIQEHIRLMQIQDMLTGYGIAHFKVVDARSGSRLVSHILAQVSRDSAFADSMQLVRAYSHLNVERAAIEYIENLLTIEPSVSNRTTTEQEVERRARLLKSTVHEVERHFAASSVDRGKILHVLEESALMGLSILELREEETHQPAWDPTFFLSMLESTVAVFMAKIADVGANSAKGTVSGTSDDYREEQSVFQPKLIADLQRIRRIHKEWQVLVSVKTLNDPQRVVENVRAFIDPQALFAGVDTTKVKESLIANTDQSKGKGKKRALPTEVFQNTSSSKRIRTATSTPECTDELRDDRTTSTAFNLHRYATQMGMEGEEYQALVAQVAAEHGDVLKAVHYSRDLFSRRRNWGASSSPSRQPTQVGETATSMALKNISLSISKYTAMHAEQIYSPQSSNGSQLDLPKSPADVARIHAPAYSLELLRYAICTCDPGSFEETFVLLKSATLLNDLLQFTQMSSVIDRRVEHLDADEKWRIYPRWFRKDTMCELSSVQTMHLATRFAVTEYQLLLSHGASCAMGIIASSSPLTNQELLPSKRFVSFLVENNADLLSLQVMMSMRWVPEEALTVIQSQLGKILSTVFQSHRIDNFLALGLMLSMDQRDAFNAFRQQISRENVAKDFNRFQQLAKIGADAARAWQQIAFLHQCVELEGNARWWSYLNLLDIQCDQKSFQSERRDLNYIRSLVPTLLEKSSYDYYTIQEFTRHYQIEDSFPALVYVEALLSIPEASPGTLEYQDRIVGVLEDIHEHRLVALLLKVLPKVPGTDYERLLFIFQLLLEHTSYAEKDEIERRIEVLHVLKAFSMSHRAVINSPSDNNIMEESTGRVCFHRLVSKPRHVLGEVLTTQSFSVLSNLVLPLRLESDELMMLLLKNVVDHHRKELDDSSVNAVEQPTMLLSGSELERLFGILNSLRAIESKVTAAEWLAENLPMSHHKLRSLEFALDVAVGSGRDAGADRATSTVISTAVITRLEQKIIRVKLHLIFATTTLKKKFEHIQEAELAQVISSKPKTIFLELYRSADTLEPTLSNPNTRDVLSLHSIADRVADVLKLNPQELRSELVRELLIQDAVYSVRNERGDNKAITEDIFTPLEDEVRDARDDQIMRKLIYIASEIAEQPQSASEDDAAASLVEYLVTFARDSKPRAGVTFRAKLRAARAVLHLGQSHRAVVAATVETKMKLAPFDVAMRELVDYIRHCRHMIVFEEHHVPYEIEVVMRAKKEALVRSFLRQHTISAANSWVLRSAARMMLDFDVQSLELWGFVLTKMKQLGMVRSLSRVLDGLSLQPFVRNIEGASVVWEATLLAPLLRMRQLSEGLSVPLSHQDSESKTWAGIEVDKINVELELMVTLLHKCPFLDQIDVAAFVVHLRDLTLAHAAGSTDLYSYAVLCAVAIPRPSIRHEALQRIIQSGAYMHVLDQVCDASVMSDEPTDGDDDDEVNEQLELLHSIFTEATSRDESDKLLGTAFEQPYLEYLASTGDIDKPLAHLLQKKRLEAASTLIELYFESHPDRAPPDWSIRDTAVGNGDNSRWPALQLYVAASTSPDLAPFRS